MENRVNIDHVELPSDIQMLPDGVSWWPLSCITDCGTNNTVAYRDGYRRGVKPNSECEAF